MLYDIKLYIDGKMVDACCRIDKAQRNILMNRWTKKYADKGNAVYVDLIRHSARIVRNDNDRYREMRLKGQYSNQSYHH